MISLSIDENMYPHFWIIPDVHGCAYTLTALLEELNPQPTDAIVFLGDLINRGPDSIQVLEIVQSLQGQVGLCVALLGNHEEQFLQGRDLGENNLRKTKKIEKQACAFFRQMPRFLALENALCVHAGFNFELSNPFEDIQAMCWIRSFEPKPEACHFRSVIHGHSPTTIQVIRDKINQYEWRIPLDNGCVFRNRVGMGNLLALELHTRKLIEMPNQEKK